MQVFQDTVAGIIANGILPRTASVVYAMYQMMRQKKRDCTGYSRFINRIQQRFKIKLRHGTPASIILFNMRSLIAVGLMSLFANLSR